MAVKQLPKLSELPEPPDRLVGDQERFDVMTFDSLKAQKKMVNKDLNKTFIPKLNEFAVDVNASVSAAAQNERNAAASAEKAEEEANEAAASAATAGTKAGEASKSAAAAKTSETNAAASKNAAAKSATDAAAAQRGAEVARDEAQNLANVGYASAAKAGLAKVDGKTTQADADGMITVKDVEIDGGALNTFGLAGMLSTVKYYPASSGADIDSELFLLSLWQGTLIPELTQYDSFFYVRQFFFSRRTSSDSRKQVAYGYRTGRMFTRIYNQNTSEWSAWIAVITDAQIGDGLTVNNGIISVPEYSGATASVPGTSGLVPPAAAREQDLFLTGGAVYKAALTQITDSVTSTATDTAASAKAVKLVYDRGSAGITAAGNAQTAANNALNVANTKLPLSGGNVGGNVGISGVLTVSPAPKDTSGEGGEIHLAPGSNGSYPAIIDARANRIRFFGKPGISPVEVDLESGKFVGNIEGIASGLGGRRWSEDVSTSPSDFLVGGAPDGQPYLCPRQVSSLNVNYANTAGYAGRAAYAEPMGSAFASAYHGNPGIITIPSGGTWVVFLGNLAAGVEVCELRAGGAQMNVSGWGNVAVFAFGIKWKN